MQRSVELPLARQPQLLAHVRAAGRASGWSCSWSCPPTRCWRSRSAASTSCFSRCRTGTRCTGTRATSQGAFSGSLPGGEYWPSIRNTIVYVAVALGLCFAIGYPVAYYIARHAKRTKTLLIVLLVIPFWISYLLRMLAWIGLLSPGGYVNQILGDIGIAHAPDWLNGNPYSVILALCYGYIPYFILPVFAGPGPDRPEPDRGRPRPRRDAVPRVPARHAAAQPPEHPGRLGAGRAADVRRLLHQRPDLGLAADEHARQRDQPVRPGRHPADRSAPRW